MTTVVGTGSGPGEVGVRGESQEAEGVRGVGHKGAGVSGTSEKWIGTYGESQEAEGVRGVGHKGAGVSGTSEKWIGTYGESQEAEGVRGVGHKGAGVSGTSEKWIGTYGESQEAEGVRGVGHKGAGVSGTSEKWIGTYGESQEAEGVRGVGHKGAGVSGTSERGPGVYGKGTPAGHFDGDVVVTGDLVLAGGDYAEEFDVRSPLVAAGSCVVLDDEGSVVPCRDDYDSRVAGVVSGAGGLKPGILLDRQPSGNRAPIALMGKAWVMVDADRGAIRPGDMLTTSTTPGHAMRVTDTGRAFGSVIGKALTPMTTGRGLVKVFLSAR